MKILAFESSAKAASVALCREENLIAQSWQNSGLTHSTTLLPMAADLLKNCGTDLGEADCLAVAVGPGSFTGLRIGISTVKGLAWGRELPCVGVSTLEALARPLAHMDGVICCVMDARRRQVYNALFRAGHETLTRLCPDRPIALEELGKELAVLDEPVILAGDGAELGWDAMRSTVPRLRLAPPHLRLQSAYGVAVAALGPALRGETVCGADLNAVYLRPSQAERERAEKMAGKREEKR